jgi:hypothetical protein
MSDEISKLIFYVKTTDSNENKVVEISKVSDEMVQKLNEAFSVNFSGFCFSIDAYAIKHILKNHNSKEKENRRGQEVVTEKDIELLPDILQNPDLAFYDGKNRLGKDCFEFQKQLFNKYVVILEIRTGKKQLALNTMRIFINKKENLK